MQIEMFSPKSDAHQNQQIQKSALSYIHNHEKAILVVIVLLLTSIVSFSLGVKKGRQLSLLENQRKVEIQPKEDTREIGLIAGEIKVIEKDLPINSLKQSGANYTIQVATYKTKTYAQREAEKLKKRGLQALVLPKGSYVQLCVGKFQNIKEAKTILKQLKSKYRDCFIRRL